MGAPEAGQPSQEFFAVIAGFGLPGRAIAEALDRQHLAYCVIEHNDKVADRCAQTGICIFPGDAREETVLKRAGVDRAGVFYVTIPDDETALQATRLARKLNPRLRIIVRCNYTSSGLRATQLGADEVIVAEQIMATEFARIAGDATAQGAPAVPKSI